MPPTDILANTKIVSTQRLMLGLRNLLMVYETRINPAPLSFMAVTLSRPTMRMGKSTENSLEIGATLSFQSPNQCAWISQAPRNNAIALHWS
jgi:hypothetical protein